MNHSPCRQFLKDALSLTQEARSQKAEYFIIIGALFFIFLGIQQNKSPFYAWFFALPYLFPAFCAFFFRLIFPLFFPRRTLPPYCDARSVIRRRSIAAAFASGFSEILKIGCLCLHNNYIFLSLGKHNAVRCNSRSPLYIRPDSAFIGKITLYFVFRQLKTITNYAVTLLCIIHKHK